jgi:cytidyltransferase-like protein
MSDTAKHVVACGGFDDIHCEDIRFLHEAARLGPLHVLLWSDELVRKATGRDPKFSQEERSYFVQALRYVEQTHLVGEPADPHQLSVVPGVCPRAWALREAEQDSAKRAFCEEHRLNYRIFTDHELAGFPEDSLPEPQSSPRKKVLVTGCYDWFHSGHVRFFEEVSELGDLYAVVGHDANIRLLKGEGHPMFDQNQRRYIVGSIRYVTQALVSTGHGWLDAEPEIERIRPDIYAVNEDGDKPEKRQYCEEHGIEYVVLKRLPKEGLPRRESTKLRGF